MAMDILENTRHLTMQIWGWDPTAGAGNGCMFDLKKNEVALYLEDQDKFIAKRLGVTIEHYRAYQKAQARGWQCQHMTRKGQPCQHTVEPKSITGFVPGELLTCSVHIRAMWRRKISRAKPTEPKPSSRR
ncbi:MAG: hypothetical protein L0G27_01215 [Paracoccus sp. (in: a-proteobacteria)]|nr:hypothetical protein [Paracoccus sp. (in: a-proteobacteria)]